VNHLYLFTLEVVPLDVGKTYAELPSHLTLMSRFRSDLSHEKLSDIVNPLFRNTPAMDLVFGKTITLGPKKLTVHTVKQSAELKLHKRLHGILDTINAEYQYPQYIGMHHVPHVTQRKGKYFEPGSVQLSPAAYLIEVIDTERIVRARFKLG
jgi:hypothetical protein